MGIGAALGVGATGAALGTAIGGPVGAAAGGVLGLLVGLMTGDEKDAKNAPLVPVEAMPTEQVAPPMTGTGPSGGGPLAPPVESMPPMTIGGAPATNAQAAVNALDRAAGGFPGAAAASQSNTLTRPEFAPTNLASRLASGMASTAGRPFGTGAQGTPSAGARSRTKSIPAPYVPQGAAPVEAVENATGMAMSNSKIPPPNPQVPMMSTSRDVLNASVKDAFQARAANITSGKALTGTKAGASSVTRQNTGTGAALATSFPPPGATATASAPIEALEEVQAEGKQVAAKTADRFAGLGKQGRSVSPFQRKG